HRHPAASRHQAQPQAFQPDPPGQHFKLGGRHCVGRSAQASETTKPAKCRLCCNSPPRPTKNQGGAGQMCLTSSISYSTTPFGTLTRTTSPFSLPISARAMGEETEILPLLISASSSPTIW